MQILRRNALGLLRHSLKIWATIQNDQMQALPFYTTNSKQSFVVTLGTKRRAKHQFTNCFSLCATIMSTIISPKSNEHIRFVSFFFVCVWGWNFDWLYLYNHLQCMIYSKFQDYKMRTFLFWNYCLYFSSAKPFIIHSFYFNRFSYNFINDLQKQNLLASWPKI